MNRDRLEKPVIREKLEEELAELRFMSQEQVLKRTHPKRLLDKWRTYWNKELEIPLAPATLLLVVLLGGSVSVGGLFLVEEQAHQGERDSHNKRVLVDTGASIYYSDLLVKADGRK